MGVAATGTMRPNQMENIPLRDMVKMNKEKRPSSDVVLMCPRTSQKYNGRIIKSVMRFLLLLVNNQFNRSNVIVIVKNGE